MEQLEQMVRRRTPSHGDLCALPDGEDTLRLMLKGPWEHPGARPADEHVSSIWRA